MKNKKFTPGLHDKIWTISSLGKVTKVDLVFISLEERLYLIRTGNVFKTKKLAERYLKIQKKYLEIRGRFLVDWSDENQVKECLYFDIPEDCVGVSGTYAGKLSGVIYGSAGFNDAVIREIGSEDIYFFLSKGLRW